MLTRVAEFHETQSFGGDRFHLTSVGCDVIVTRVLPPFESSRLTPEGDRALIAQPEMSTMEKVQSGYFRGWVSLPLIPLDKGYIQVLANLRSDQRLLIRYGIDGEQRATRELDAPVGLLGSLVSQRLIVGIRDLGSRTEAVMYRWQWRQEDPSFLQGR